MEIFITALIASLAAFILYKNAKGKMEGKCECDSCSSHCNKYKPKEK